MLCVAEGAEKFIAGNNITVVLYNVIKEIRTDN